MHVISPHTYNRPQPVPKKKHYAWRIIPLLLLAVAAVNYLRPLPAATASVTVNGLSATGKPAIAWPSAAQSAIGAPDYGVLAASGTDSPLATASIAKVILALCVLQKQPFTVGQKGVTYTVTAQDVQIYDDYVAQNGSVAAVALDERLTEYQALEALMLPSANNVADSLVRWVFGSQAAYRAYASDFIATHGLSQTTIGTDASGYDPSTASTATDLTKLGLLALKNPVLTRIAAERSTDLPIAGTVNNYDTVLGQNGINGLKTGNNDADPGAFLFTANVSVGDKQVPVTGAVMGAADLQTALDGAAQLSRSMQQSFEQVTVSQAGSQVGTMRTAWGQSQPIIAAQQVQLVRWKDTALGETHQVRSSLSAGTVGNLTVTGPGTAVKTDLVLRHPVAGPSFWWRLTRH